MGKIAENVRHGAVSGFSLKSVILIFIKRHVACYELNKGYLVYGVVLEISQQPGVRCGSPFGVET